MRLKASPGLYSLSVLCLLLSTFSLAQTRVKDRIVNAISSSEPTLLSGNVHPQARAEFDRGRVADDFPLERITLVFKPSQAQQDALAQLLQEQQDPGSPKFHKWLTPEQFANQFGISQNDLNKVANWLEAQGFTIVDLPRSRTRIVFSGSAAQVTSVFHTEIHQFVVNGETHYANLTEPSVPSAFAGMVSAVRALNDFRPKPKATTVRHVRPNFTSSISGNHFVAPDDFATIYDLKTLYSQGIDGKGQTIAIMGQTDIVLSDIATFRSVANLPASAPQVILVPGSADPGVVSGDINEASLDLEWSGAVARNATLIYVNSKNGAFDSLQYAIEQDLAPVLSISYGDCEPNFTSAEVASLVSLTQQANAQGQTIFVAAGDAGAADCDFPATPKQVVTVATHGLAVDLPASLPSVTAVGGTEFNEGSGTFWAATNNSTGGSAVSYIPETGWNDTASAIANGGGLAAGGGGVSTLFPKPVWQSGSGVPNDGARDLPDIAFAASSDHDGYLACIQGSCVNGFRAADNSLTVIGGTSAGAPAMAGVLALINQKTNQIQGNANPRLYELAASSPEAFHDITVGNNHVPCTAGTKNCPSGGTIGYDAQAGYDLVTGLGSVDVFNLVNVWALPASASDFQLNFANPSFSVKRGATGSDVLTISSSSGFSGNVTLTCSLAAKLAGATCAVTPNRVAPGGTATLIVTAPMQIAGLQKKSAISGYGWAIENSLVLAAGLLFAARKTVGSRRKLMKRLGAGSLFALMLIALLAALGCGGSAGITQTTSPSTGNTSVTGIVTVQATSGSLAHFAQVTVTLN